ncbi:MAG: TonB-dependent receptor [Planctomycetes bacterium]|nr:TonB-dependent receptor [Planctomycetota bacterium]
MAVSAAAEPAGLNRTDEDDARGASEPLDESLLELDIEQLGHVDVVVPAFDVEVTSVTKSESTVGHSPTAIFVIDQEMIRRSGATSVPELLRMAPGIHVARAGSGVWAISARGGNGVFANKLLVLIDGRSVYTPLFAGVYWDVQDLVLEDIDRIEVIRGPGASVWGANAVNGVINIITKKANQTRGTLVSAIGGTEDRTITSVRYGGQISENVSYRVYGKHREVDHGFLPGGASDDWRQGRFGFRIDWEPQSCAAANTDQVTVQGDYYIGETGLRWFDYQPAPLFVQTIPDDERVEGGNILARWTHRTSDSTQYWLQFYFDQANRRNRYLSQQIGTLDVEFVHASRPAETHQLTWGLHYRHVRDDLPSLNPSRIEFVPRRRRTNLISGFIQDEITLIEDALFFTLGTKLEHNAFTQIEVQPTARILWSIDSRHAAWAAVSRAVRTPSRYEDDIRLIMGVLPAPGPPTYLMYAGDRGVEAEQMIAMEAGYRAQPVDSFSWDVAAFTYGYRDLINWVVDAPYASPIGTIIPLVARDLPDWEWGYGVELAAEWQVTPQWKLFGNYTFRHFDAGAFSPNVVYLQSSWDLPSNWEFDLIGAYVDDVERLPDSPVPSFDTSDYISLALRLAWHYSEALEFAVVGQNLLDEHRREFLSELHAGSEVQRAVYAQVIWRR